MDSTTCAALITDLLIEPRSTAVEKLAGQEKRVVKVKRDVALPLVALNVMALLCAALFALSATEFFIALPAMAPSLSLDSLYSLVSTGSRGGRSSCPVAA